MAYETSTITHVQIWVPIPPVELSKNGRANPFDRNRIYQEHKMLARAAVNRVLPSGFEPWRGPVDVSIVWRQHHTGYWPDRDNTITRLTSAMDGAEDAGLFANDRQIRSYRLDYVKDADEGVSITFTHDEEAE